jgi:beta-RFAP synthase
MPLADATQSEPPSDGSPSRQRIRGTSEDAVRVVAPARLHLGFLDLNGSLGRRFGSIGLAIDRPATELILSRAGSLEAEGPDHARALSAIRRVREIYGLTGSYHADVLSAIPPHAGLGSGTQLALAAGVGLMALEGMEHGTEEIGGVLERGARSAIGIGAFASGGFIVDGGRGAEDRPPPILVRADFPDAWRALLILDNRTAGVHGTQEAKAFAELPPLPENAAAHVCRLVLMQLTPGLMEGDSAAFGAALTEIQTIIGSHFAVAQGGQWTSPGVGRIAQKLKAEGAFGIGQSSWGPTGFAFAASKEIAQRLYDSVIEAARAEGLEMLIAKGRNRGASVERIASTQSQRDEGKQ